MENDFGPAAFLSFRGLILRLPFQEEMV